MNEDSLVARIESAFRSQNSTSLALSFGDDAALWKPSRGRETILACDWFLESSHFLRDQQPPDSVGWKCLARALSDIAAMGGAPRCFLLSLALPDKLTGEWLGQFLRGLRNASSRFDCTLAGGDTTKREKVLISIAVIGEVRPGRSLLRTGANPGDAIFISGRLGEAEAGLRQLRHMRRFARASNSALRKHLYPEPRLALGRWLAENRWATAMMDLSDGLSTDLPRLCAASRVGARIDVASLPLVTLPKRGEAIELALHGGDDYELLFTVNPRKATRLPARFKRLALTQVGEITRQKDILLQIKGRDRPLRSGGWDPFR